MVLTFIKMEVQRAKRKERRQTIRSLVEQVRMENGCVESNYYQNVEDQNDFFLVEEWKTRKAFDDHLRSINFTVLMGSGSLLSRPPEIVIHTVSNSSELEP